MHSSAWKWIGLTGSARLIPPRGIRRKDQEIEAMMKNSARQFSKHGNETRGFTLIEALVVLAVTAILMAIAIPQFQRITQALRISGDMRDITGTVGQAKMHAAADFTHGRARANLVANTFPANTFQLEIWNKAGAGGAGCWQTVGDAANANPL